jgi:very-short-patch-repair endonuclease
MNLKQIARRLRRHETDEEKELWRTLRGRRFAGFKFRRQHSIGEHILDFYCAAAKLAIELDGFQHGLPEGIQRDENREKYLTDQGIETLRFWNHQWRRIRKDVCWRFGMRLTGCIRVINNIDEQRFIPPPPEKIISKDRNGPSP